MGKINQGYPSRNLSSLPRVVEARIEVKVEARIDPEALNINVIRLFKIRKGGIAMELAIGEQLKKVAAQIN